MPLDFPLEGAKIIRFKDYRIICNLFWPEPEK